MKASSPAIEGRSGAVSPADEGVWTSIPHAWKQLYGDFAKLGVSIEIHAFHISKDFDWAKSFRPGGLELCLNRRGSGKIRGSGEPVAYRHQTFGFYGMGSEPLKAVRTGGEDHAFLTVECTREFLRRQLSGYEEILNGSLREWLEGAATDAVIGPVRPMNFLQQQLLESLQHPPVMSAIRGLWYQSKISEVLALTLFQAPPEGKLHSRRGRMQDRERAERVVELLRQNLVEPPDLETLGRHIGCSPFYLSRTFSKVMGKTIPQMLRELRIRRAAELLRSGKYNVTEVALEVGYTSLSHFSTAFCQLTGCSPSLYPHSRQLITTGY